MASQRIRVKGLYKTLLFMGREYPAGAEYFRSRLRNAFMKNRDITDPNEIDKLIARGQFVIKELEALYMLRKYRAMKQRYYDEDELSKLEKIASVDSVASSKGQNNLSVITDYDKK